MNVADWIRKWASILPKKVALIYDDRPITYREINDRVNRLANYLLRLGVREGDLVAVLLRNCVEFMEIFFATSKINAIFVPLNFRLVASEVVYILRDCSAGTLFFGEEFVETVEKVRGEVPIDEGRFICIGEAPPWAQQYERALEGSPAVEPSGLRDTDPETPHIIMYTSGTTGFPKGATLSQRKTFFNVLNANIYYHATPDDRMLVSRPLFHSGGLLVDSLPFLYKGATVVMKKRFSPQELLETVERYKITVLETSATMYRFILEQCDPDASRLSSVKCFFTGGENVPLSLLRAYSERGIVICQVFGQTEASTITWLPVEHGLRKMGSVGLPVFHGEVKIVDEEGKEVPPGEIGEIVVSGPILMSGYWGRPDLTAETIKDGWLHTGDLGVRDEEGFYYVIDRGRNMFISGGENVYPAEVERVLLENPKILEAAVVGVPDPKWGEVGKAFIVVKEGEVLTREDVIQWCLDRLAKYKIPKHIEFVEALPKNAAGKIVRHVLKEWSVKGKPDFRFGSRGKEVEKE